MSKGLEALKDHKTFLRGAGFRNCECWENLKNIEKELKVLEIIKPYIHIHCVAPNDRGGVRIWFTQDGKHYVDMPQEEYDLLKEVGL